jgi:hypothetical protein
VFAASVDPYTSLALLRVDASGALDSAWGEGGVRTLNVVPEPLTESPRALGVMANGSYLVSATRGIRGVSAAFLP